MSDNNGSTPYGSQNQNPQDQNPQHDPQGQPGGYPSYPNQAGWQNGPNQQNGQWQQQAPQQPKKNWFLRHKILTAILALAVIGIIASVAGGSKKDSTASGVASSAQASSGSSGTKAETKGGETKNGASKSEESKSDEDKGDALPAVGQPIRDGKFEFIVTKVERDVPSIGSQYLDKKAQGSYTLVHVTVKNVGDESQTLSADDQKAYDAQGVGYKATSDGAIYIQGNDTLYTEINPGNTLKGVLVFDAPKGTKLTKVRLHDSMFSNGSEGSLG